jgi:hypothetical protein
MEEKNLFLELLNMQQSVEEKKKMIDILRTIRDFYDDNYSFPVFGMSDERVEFLEEVFLDPLATATDEISSEIGYESTRDRMWRKFWECRLKPEISEQG